MRTSKAVLQTALRQAENEKGMLHCVLNDLINNRVKWFSRGKQRVGISRPRGAEGGLVIHREIQADGGSYAVAYHWEAWFPDILNNVPRHDDKDACDLRNAAIDAHAYIQKEQSK